MTQEQRDWGKAMGFDRLPTDIIGKRVTELMDLSGRKAIVIGAGGDGLANMVAYLATDAANYMCGQTIDVAGGQWMG